MGNLLRKGKSQKTADGGKNRELKANDRHYNEQFRYATNYIKTSKYNILSFLPKNLFEQFQRLANFYFLILMILQLIPQISPLTPYTTILPLIAVLSITALKDAVDDIARHRSDNQVNNRESRVVRCGRVEPELWERVKVGEIIRMENGNFIAADLLLLSTSEPHGLCYIETAELDGETNLKARQALPETAVLLDNHEMIGKFDGVITCDPPNNNLNTFMGTMAWRGTVYSLDNNKVLLRGCVLRNTRWCYGLVLYAGRETKLMMNSGKTKFKRTSLDRFLNVLIVGIVMFLLSMCLICSILCGVWEWTTGRNFRFYLPWLSLAKNLDSGQGYVSAIAAVVALNFLSYGILLNTVVPISLYVSVEIIRFCHSWWINWDEQMYYAKTDTAARARTTTLNEELGQVQYVFSDKTGTLTQNIMTFNKCSVGGKSYGTLFDEAGNAIEVTEKTRWLDLSDNRWSEEKFRFYDQTLLIDTKSGLDGVDMFWRLLALCHTVMGNLTDDGCVLEYQAQSPDEEALVSAARNFGYVFKSRTPTSITIEVDGVDQVYELLSILDFNNERKRMSVLVRERDASGRVLLLCKGADTMVMSRCLLQTDKQRLVKNQTEKHLDKFAGEGLRTLCCAYKIILPAELENWRLRHHKASVAIEERQSKLDAVYDEIEQNLQLIGATAIEDKLQDGVPDTIASLMAANMKVWVLTGDKQETAINIGYSCRLLTETMREIFVVDAETKNEVETQLYAVRHRIRAACRQTTTGSTISAEQLSSDAGSPPGPDDMPSTSSGFEGDEPPPPAVFFRNANNGRPKTSAQEDELPATQQQSSEAPTFALVVNGHSLDHALTEKLESVLLEVACRCSAAICCRVTPLQKAMVVELVKRNKKAVTLAIGDGANDVSMIKVAHIGVGISGQEGMQAVLSSDFSIGQFRFLERLLLVHGRWSYFRMSKFVRYFFYKNFVMTLAHFWYAFFCGYSAQTVYDEAFIACYNLFFTALPVIGLGVFDQDVNDVYSIRTRSIDSAAKSVSVEKRLLLKDSSANISSETTDAQEAEHWLEQEQSLAFPRLYIPGQYNLYFNMRIFIYSVLHGVLSSAVLFFVPYFALRDNVSPAGQDVADYALLSFTVFTSVVLVVTAQVALETAYWTIFNHIFVWGSLIFYFCLAVVLNQLIPSSIVASTPSATSLGSAFRAAATPQFWLATLLSLVLLILPVLLGRFYLLDTRPDLSDRLRVRQNLPRIQRRRAALADFPLRPLALVRSAAAAGSSSARLRRGRSRKASVRSGYAFSHQQGFGDLITKGKLWNSGLFHIPSVAVDLRRRATAAGSSNPNAPADGDDGGAEQQPSPPPPLWMMAGAAAALPSAVLPPTVTEEDEEEEREENADRN